MAGESARRQYEAARAKRRDALHRHRWVLVAIAVISSTVGAVAAEAIIDVWWLGALIGLLPVVTLVLPSQNETAWRKGADGEEAVGRALDQIASARALHDRLVPGSKANIDHILVAPTGVWTIDAKNYSGKIETRRAGSELWINGRNRSKLLAQAQAQRDVVRKALANAGLGQVPVRPSLCFLDVEWPLLFRPKFIGDVALISPRRLRTLPEGQSLLPSAQVQRVAAALNEALRPAVADPSRSHSTPTARQKTTSRPTADGAAAANAVELIVRPWKRYGKDRLYVDDHAGETLGYVDLQTNEVVPTDERYRETVRNAAADYLRQP